MWLCRVPIAAVLLSGMLAAQVAEPEPWNTNPGRASLERVSARPAIAWGNRIRT